MIYYIIHHIHFFQLNKKREARRFTITVAIYGTIEVIQFWIPPNPREIRLKKLNVSHTLYCNVLPLTVYFIGKLSTDKTII
jgi:hypothetical protein